MLDKNEAHRLASLSATDKPKAVSDQIDRIHRAVHAGTLDAATIDDALARIQALSGKASAPAINAKPSRPLPRTQSPPLAPR